MTNTLLHTIQSPADFKGFNLHQLQQLSDELRQYLIDTILVSGGHFSANLGVVELTISLHTLFNTPVDQLIWDVGHQAYAHKVLTGRKEALHSIRQTEGISGFPKREENPFDAFGTGHSSTSISAALGMAEAAYLQGDEKTRFIAVIGDGSLTGGMAFEALNNAGVSKANLVVVINDNHMGIDPNEGALGKYLQGLNPTSHKNLFTDLGFQYFGPSDGHDLNDLLAVGAQVQAAKGPVVWHVRTVKGKGYAPAEKEQTKWHSASRYVKLSGGNIEDKKTLKYQEVFGLKCAELAGKIKNLVAVTPAMPTGSGLVEMMENHPQRVFDVGIAEQHALTFSAGLALNGMQVFTHIYSTFLQRGYDQLIHDIALQNIPINLFVDRAGLAGEDGPTHHGMFDLAYLRSIPNLRIAAPKNAVDLCLLMEYAAQNDSGPLVVRYPKDRTDLFELPKSTDAGQKHAYPIENLRSGNLIAVLSIGSLSQQVEKALELLSDDRFAHYNVTFLKPLDSDSLLRIAENYDQLITVEEGTIFGGLGSAVMEFLQDHNVLKPVKRFGVPDVFQAHGTRKEMLKQLQLDAQGIANQLRAMV